MSERRRVSTWCLLLAVAGLVLACKGPQAGQEAGAQQDVDWRFVGDDSYHDFELRRVVEDQLLDFEKQQDRESLLVDAASDLADHYEAEGFPEARVRYRIERERRPVRVVFEIEEGPRVTIADMHLRGNRSLRAAELLPLWSRKRSGLLGTGDPYFVRSELESFRMSIRARYRDRGFLDVEVQGPHVEREAKGSTARIAYDIVEGQRYVLVSLEVDQDLLDAVPEDARAGLDASMLALKPYEVLELDAYRNRLRKLLQDHGYPAPSLRLEVEVRREAKPGEVRASLGGEAGPRRRIHAVEVKGNDRTAHRIIRRRIDIEAGSWYDASKIDRAVSALYLTGLFARIEVQREAVPGHDADLITFVVEENEAREVGALVGYGSYELARAKLFLADNNLFGIGQSMRLTGKVSQRSYGADLTWREPSLFASETGLGVTAAIAQREEPSFTDIERSLAIAFDRRLFEATQLRFGYAIARSDGSDIDVSLRNLVVDDYLVSTVFSELAYDDRDSRLFPTRGKRALLRFELADPSLGGDLRFQRVNLQLGFNAELAERWIVSVAVQSGAVWTKGNLPVQERFFNGGNATVRSFDQAELGPKTLLGTPTGGEFRNVLGAELRFPIFGPLEGAVFGDAGNVGRAVEDFGFDDLRYAIGGGLRFVLPIGPVRFDAGVNPNPRFGEDDYTLHLSVGYPF